MVANAPSQEREELDQPLALLVCRGLASATKRYIHGPQ